MGPRLRRHSGNIRRGTSIDAGSLCVQAPSVVEIHLPADLVAGCELVTTGVLDKIPAPRAVSNCNCSRPSRRTNLPFCPAPQSLCTTAAMHESVWNAASTNSGNLFPAALCYTKIVPVDEVVTLTLFYREDNQLVRLMLDDKQKHHLDRLWDELRYISQDALTLVDAFAQLMEYATQDADPKVFEPLRKPINDRAAAFRQTASRHATTPPRRSHGFRSPRLSATVDRRRQTENCTSFTTSCERRG